MFQWIKIMIQTQDILGQTYNLLENNQEEATTELRILGGSRNKVMFQLAQSVADPVWIEGQDVPADQDDDPASCE